MQDIKFVERKELKVKPKAENLKFGTDFSDYMFVMDYEEGLGWHNPQIMPYSSFEVDPALMVFHYGQAIFEGLKAYKDVNGNIVSFRPMDNIKRLNVSAERLCIPKIDEEFTLIALKRLLNIEKDWVPELEGTSLYIRPFIIATDPFIGVRPSNTYKFFIILSPVGAYYAEGFNPVKIYVTDEYVRAAKGGVGYTKTAGNYAASLYAAKMAKEKGYTQVLWLDASEHEYVEEVGTMNIFFKIDNKIITPSLGGSILSGITRNSVITLAKDLGYEVEERSISINEVFNAHNKGKLEEIFGTGTAAVISPVGTLRWKEDEIVINNGEVGEFSQKIYEIMDDIKCGRREDKYNWIQKIC